MFITVKTGKKDKEKISQKYLGKKLKYLSNKKGFLGIDNKANIKEKVVVVPFGIEKTVSIIETFLKNGINSFYLIPPIYKKGERDYKLANSVIAKIKNNWLNKIQYI